MITVSIDEFKEYDGRDLTLELRADDSNEITTANRFLKMCSRKIYEYIRMNSARNVKSDEKMSSTQVETLKNAMCEYGIFILRNGDVDNQPETAVKMPTHIHTMLKVAGLITSNLGRKNYIGIYDYEKF